MCHLRQAFLLAQEVGARLGQRALLFGPLPGGGEGLKTRRLKA
nr:hypothetical protein [Deinococcus sp.]